MYKASKKRHDVYILYGILSKVMSIRESCIPTKTKNDVPTLQVHTASALQYSHAHCVGLERLLVQRRHALIARESPDRHHDHALTRRAKHER